MDFVSRQFTQNFARVLVELKDHCWSTRRVKPNTIPNGAWAELRKFYYEIAHGTWRQNLLALKEFVPTSQVLFGTDYTPEPIETTVRELPNSPYSRDELQQIERTNAEKLFPRFKL